VKLILELALLAASFGTGPVAEQIRLIGIITIAALGVAAVFCAVVVCVAVLQQRQPPFPI
jgi:hypothetical protein